MLASRATRPQLYRVLCMTCFVFHGGSLTHIRDTRVHVGYRHEGSQLPYCTRRPSSKNYDHPDLALGVRCTRALPCMSCSGVCSPKGALSQSSISWPISIKCFSEHSSKFETLRPDAVAALSEWRRTRPRAKLRQARALRSGPQLERSALRVARFCP
jgi:hypothetical protein